MNFDDKEKVLNLVLKELRQNLEVLVKSAFEAKEFSTNEESKAENKYDTRGLEASYLASGQAQRAQKLKEQIYLIEKVELQRLSGKAGIGSIVEVLIEESQKKYLFLLPSGGVEVDYHGEKIQTITIESPIGNNLHENESGHEFEINGKLYEVVEVI